MLSLTVTAFGASISASASDNPAEGEAVMVDIVLNDNPGVQSLTVRVVYPSDSLTLITAINAGQFDNFNQNFDSNGVVLTFSTNAANDNSYYGTIASLLFEVKDASAGYALVTVSCESAYNINNVPVTVDGNTTIVVFSESAGDDIDLGDDSNDDDEEIIDEDEIINDEPAVTTTATKKTEATTTTKKKTEATTTTKKKTEATTTTTKATTTESTTTSVTTTSEVLTTPEVTTTSEYIETEPTFESEVSDIENIPDNSLDTPDDSTDAIVTGNDYSKRASGATVVLAVSVLITTLLLAGGIEVYKRFFADDDSQED